MTWSTEIPALWSLKASLRIYDLGDPALALEKRAGVMPLFRKPFHESMGWWLVALKSQEPFVLTKVQWQLRAHRPSTLVYSSRLLPLWTLWEGNWICSAHKNCYHVILLVFCWNFFPDFFPRSGLKKWKKHKVSSKKWKQAETTHWHESLYINRWR